MNKSKRTVSMHKTGILKTALLGALLLSYLGLTACAANVGVGLNVSVPIGHHGHISIGSGSWF